MHQCLSNPVLRCAAALKGAVRDPPGLVNAIEAASGASKPGQRST